MASSLISALSLFLRRCRGPACRPRPPGRDCRPRRAPVLPGQVDAAVAAVAGRQVTDDLLEYRCGLLMAAQEGEAAAALDVDVSPVQPGRPGRLPVARVSGQRAGLIERAQGPALFARQRQAVRPVGLRCGVQAAAGPGHRRRGVGEVNGALRVAHVAGQGIELLRPSLKRENKRYAEPLLNKARQLIESVSDTLNGQLDPERRGGRTFEGVTVRVT